MRAPRPPRPSLRLWVAGALALALLSPAGARARDDDDTRALRVQFARGLSLEAAGRWADALARFEEVHRARPTANVRFHVALCLDRLGRFLLAEQAYRDARRALPAGDAGPLADIDARLRDLDARTPRIVVVLDGATEGVTLSLDGAPIAAAEPLRADPGPHLVAAVRDGVTVAAAAFSATERRIKIVSLTIYPASEPSGAGGSSPVARATPPR